MAEIRNKDFPYEVEILDRKENKQLIDYYGTTLVQVLVWLLGNNLDYKRALSTNINERFPFIESTTQFEVKKLPINEDQKEKLRKSQLPVTLEELEEMPSPRLIKSHLPLSLLPPTLLDTLKVKQGSIR